ncbi:MAG: oligosaccharide repeat unit polymerase [Firmicutes bacterium]|nr:oligosaccharide repeat unit polymerase [Bacillota bacterium]
MGSITLLVFIIFTFAALMYYRKDILGPWFLLCAMMTVSFCIVLLNTKNWEVIVVPKFTAYCSVALLSWFAGALVVRAFPIAKINVQKSNIRIYKEQEIKERISNGSYPYVLLMCLSIGLTLMYLYTKIPLSSITSVESFKTALRSLYDTEKTYGFFRTQIFELIVAIAYISLYKRMSVQYMRPDRRMRIRLDIPVALFLLCTLVSTDRNILLRFMIYFVILFVMFFRDSINLHVGRKLIVRIALLAVLAGGVFFIFGAAKQYTSNVTRALGIYGGSGLYNFNLWIKDFNGPLAYGKYTFADLQNVMSRLHFMKPSDVPFNAEFTNFVSANGYTFSSNVYSALRFYVQDFGIWGVIVVPFLTGIFFEILYVVTKLRPYGFAWVFYASSIYPVIYYPILEQLMKRMNFGRVYEIGWLVVFYFVLFSAYGITKYRFKRRNFVLNRSKIKPARKLQR